MSFPNQDYTLHIEKHKEHPTPKRCEWCWEENSGNKITLHQNWFKDFLEDITRKPSVSHRKDSNEKRARIVR